MRAALRADASGSCYRTCVCIYTSTPFVRCARTHIYTQAGARAEPLIQEGPEELVFPLSAQAIGIYLLRFRPLYSSLSPLCLPAPMFASSLFLFQRAPLFLLFYPLLSFGLCAVYIICNNPKMNRSFLPLMKLSRTSPLRSFWKIHIASIIILHE